MVEIQERKKRAENLNSRVNDMLVTKTTRRNKGMKP